MGIPLRSGNQVFGAIVVQSYSANMRFGEKEKELLTFVSQNLASAIVAKRHAEALRRSEARYRSLVESAAYGIYRSNVEGKFLDVNPALVALLGYSSAEEVLALDPMRDVFVVREDALKVGQAFRAGRQGDGVEVRWKRKRGNPITVRLSGRSVPQAGNGTEVLEVMAEDVTERRALEEQFRQAQKMEAVGRLAGGIAHDFNNLLMVISGYTEVLLEKTPHESPLYPKMEAVQQATDRASSLTHQLLAFSRKQLVELKVVDVNTIVQDMERLLRPLIGETIDLRTQLASNLGWARADAGQIEQVLMNLVVNAKDAMPNGGTITLRSANVRLDDEARREYGSIRPGRYVLLSVSDTGCGMDPETRSRIFEPFFTTKEKGKGTGLGLSTVYGIIKQISGYVFVQTEPGQGSTFTIYLPLVEEAAELAPQPLDDKAVNGGGETILLAEDEESVRQLVSETLTAKGYRVLEAERGEVALRIAAETKESIQMLITDVVMPGLGGRELAQKLCSADPQLKVLFLSGYTEDAIIHQGVLEPGLAFLQKPFTLQMLVRKVQETLRSGSGLKAKSQSA
jgi:PAS domain S-box-containing protein